MSMDIIGLGTATPPFSISRQEGSDTAALFSMPDAQQARLLPVLYRKSGVDRRFCSPLEAEIGEPIDRQDLFWPMRDATDHGPSTAQRMQRYERYAGELAHRAATNAFADAKCHPEKISHLVTVSCSGFYAPGFDIALMESLKLSPTIARTHVGFMGCHGAMNGLRVAHAFTQSDPNARVLVCATELCSLHYRYGWDPDAIITNAIFADGAAATICVPSASQSRWQLRRSGSMLMPDSKEAMTWRIGDHGFEMTLSARVPELIHRHLRPWLESWLAEQSLTLNDVQTWAVHPGGPRILQEVTEALGLRADALQASRGILAEFGNMSSPTVLFVLERLAQEKAPRPCVALGFGPGLVAEVMLLD